MSTPKPRWCVLCEKWGDHSTDEHRLSYHEQLIIEQLRHAMDSKDRTRRPSTYVTWAVASVIALIVLAIVLTHL